MTVIGEEPVNVSPESSEAATYQDPVVRELVLNVTCAFDNVVLPPVRVYVPITVSDEENDVEELA